MRGHYRSFATLRAAASVAAISLAITAGPGIALADTTTPQQSQQQPGQQQVAQTSQQQTGNAANASNQGSPAPQQHPQSIGHYPILDIVPSYDNIAPPGATAHGPYQNWDVGGTLTIPLARGLSASFDRNINGTLNTAAAPVLEAGGGVIGGPGVVFPAGTAVNPGLSRDIVDQERLDYTFLGGHVTAELAEYFRHRAMADPVGTSGVSGAPYPYTISSTEAHTGNFGLTFQTGGIAELHGLNIVANITAERQNVDHHVAFHCGSGATLALDNASLPATDQCPAAGAYIYIDENPNQNQYYTTTQSVALVYPVNKYGTTFLLKETWGALNWYENQPGPWFWNSFTQYQLTQKLGPQWTIGGYITNLHQRIQGYPYETPNAVEVGAAQLFLDYHVDFNQIFH